MKDSNKNKKNKTQRRRLPDGPIVRDWSPLLAAMKDVIDWALDIAVALSRDIEEDVESIEKVRACFHAWLAGQPCELDTTDLLLTLATILAAVEIDLGIDSVNLLAPIKTIVADPALPRVIRFPGADRSSARTVVIRRCPGASFATTQLAA